jgi:hypothetical protein
MKIDPNTKTLKVSSVNHYDVKQESLAYQGACRSRKPLGFEHWTSIETERAIVHGNRELIRIYEEKVKNVIERVREG